MAIQTLEPHLVESLQSSAREILETMVFMTPDNIEVVPEIESSFKSEVVGLLGFTGTRSGNFVVRTKQPRPGRNPQTGEEIVIEARRVLTFKPSNVLKTALNDE